MSTMPPLKHKRGSKSPLLLWLMKRGDCDFDTANNAFESAKQARYLIYRDGQWHYDANTGFDHWNKKPTGSIPAPPPEPIPEDETEEQFRARIAAEKAGASPPPPTKEQAVTTPPTPEPETLEQMAARMQAAYAAAKAGALDDCRSWPRMTKAAAMERAAQEWPLLDTAQHAELFKALASAGTIITGPDWIRGNPA